METLTTMTPPHQGASGEEWLLLAHRAGQGRLEYGFRNLLGYCFGMADADLRAV